MINVDKELQRLLLQKRESEEEGLHGPSDSFMREMSFYDIVANGDVKMLPL